MARIQRKQDDFLKEFIKQNSQMVKYMSRLDKTLEAINDQNVLHTQTLQANASAIKQAAEVNKNVVRLFSFLLILQAAAIIIIAGAEKVFQYLPDLPIFK